VHLTKYIWTRSKFQYLEHKAAYIHSFGRVVIAFPLTARGKLIEKVSNSSIFTILSIINWMNNYDFRMNRICFLEARILNKDVEKWGNLKILIASVLLGRMEYTIFSELLVLQKLIY